MGIPQVRDILYFDFEKASSIWSQFQWGQLEKISITSEETSDVQAGAGLGIPNLAEVKLNIGEGEKRTILETRILHHDLLNRIESLLSSAGLVVNVNQSLKPDEVSAEVIHEAIGETPFIAASGQSVIEDYQHILSISEKFNDLAKFIGPSAIEGVKKSPEYMELARTINEVKEDVKSITDRNKKVQPKAHLQGLENQLENLLQSQVSSVDQWVLDGIKLWITTFTNKN